MVVEVENIVNKGYGLARRKDGKIIFVDGGYPGEVVDVEITKEKKDHAFAVVKDILKASPARISPKCPYFGKCGGCNWLDVKYEEQLKFKKRIVENIFHRQVGVSEIEEVVPSSIQKNYRTKVEFTAGYSGGKIFLGFNMKKSHRLIEIDECLIAPQRANQIIEVLPGILEAFEVDIYSFQRKRGVLKHVVIRHAFSTDQTMVIFVTKTESFYQASAVSKTLVKKLPWIHSVIHVMNSKDNVILRGPYRTLHGEGIITEEYDWEIYQIPPTAFFQSNYDVAGKLSQKVFEVLELSGRERILDLYSGIGFFSLRVATAAKKVIGVEYSRVAVKAAVSNAHINDRNNVKFLNRDVSKFLKDYEGKVDAVIIDPPREGMDKEAVKNLIRISPRKIVYVSCEPSTLARDVKILMDGGYKIELVQPFDMFPNTYHIETLVFLTKG